MHFHSSLAGRGAEVLRDRVRILLDLSLYRQALAEIHRSPGWDSDPEALRQIGHVMHRFAPHSNDRGCTYSLARVLYRTAVHHTRDEMLRAEALSDLGTTYFEEGRFEDAVDAFVVSRSSVPWRHSAHLGLLAIACATRDLGMIRRRCEDFVDDLPSWHASREAVASLATSAELAFLRASPRLFHECLGSELDEVRALHDRYCLDELQRALAGFEVQDREEREGVTDLAGVVRTTFDTVVPILRSHPSTLPDVSAASLQARIGI